MALAGRASAVDKPPSITEGAPGGAAEAGKGAAEKLACAVALAVFAGGAAGLLLERLPPDEFTTGGPRDMIGAVVGLLTLLSALVLGLLIWTAFGVYSGQSLAVQTLAVKLLQLDLALADYGPEASWGRASAAGPRQDPRRDLERRSERRRVRRPQFRCRDRQFAPSGRVAQIP